MYIYIISIICVILIIGLRRKKNHQRMFGYKSVPSVEYNFPIVGHGIQFSRDIIGFIKKCKSKYGNIFHIKVFRKNICVVCDKNMIQEFFKKKEDEMSMYSYLKSIYFDYAFSDNGDGLNRTIDIMNNTVGVRFDEFLPKIIEESKKMVESIKIKNGMKLTPITIKFVSRTSARCFLGISLTDEMSKNLSEFTELLNRIVPLTYFLPKWLIRNTIGRILIHYRKKFNNLIKPYIFEYRNDPTKTESLIFRHCIDRSPKMTDDEICDSILCLMYVSSENTALGLNATLIDLLKNPIYMEKLRAELLLNGNEDKRIIKEQANLLNSCVLESARMNSHVFAITRDTNKSSTLGDYYIGNIDHVVLCEPILMLSEDAIDNFKNPSKYYPERFLIDQSLRNPMNVMTWGAGPHLCPGKMFAIYEIKTGVLALLRKYKMNAINIPKIDYFSPSAFGDMINTEIYAEENIFVEKNYTIQKIGNGYLIRNYFNEEKQIEIYEHLVDISKNSQEHLDIIKEPTKRAFPICMWNNVYTGTSNCTFPDKLIEYGNKIISEFPDKIGIKNIDSVYGQLFGADGYMAAHYDERIDWGISINLGASAVFTFGKDQNNNINYVVLNSGDVFLGDFATNLHSIEEVMDNVPSWFTKTKNYGRTRCSIQLRNATNVKIEKITDNEFKAYLKSY